jgi:hypothetical protein
MAWIVTKQRRSADTTSQAYLERYVALRAVWTYVKQQAKVYSDRKQAVTIASLTSAHVEEV